MPDIAQDVAALEEARTVLAAEARRVPGLADRFGASPTPALGGLDSSVADAIAMLARALVADLEAAGTRLGEADRALDAVVRLVRDTEDVIGDALTRVGAEP